MRTAGLAGVLSLVVLVGACGGGGHPAPSTIVTSTTVPVTAPPPPDLKFGSPEEAVRHVIMQWQAGDREAAGQAATPEAVQALFAKPAQVVQFRSCAHSPSANLGTDCIYRYGDGLLRLHLTVANGDWTVAAVTFEHA